MASTTLSVPSPFFTYTGKLISSLLDLVESAEQVRAEDATELEREPRPLTIEEVLDGSAGRARS